LRITYPTAGLSRGSARAVVLQAAEAVKDALEDDAADLDALAAELLAVVDQTMRPTQAWLWLRPSYAEARATAGSTGNSRPGATQARTGPGSPKH
jgi:hypothetical protein